MREHHEVFDIADSLICRAVASHCRDSSEACQRLGISPTTLRTKIQRTDPDHRAKTRPIPPPTRREIGQLLRAVIDLMLCGSAAPREE